MCLKVGALFTFVWIWRKKSMKTEKSKLKIIFSSIKIAKEKTIKLSNLCWRSIKIENSQKFYPLSKCF